MKEKVAIGFSLAVLITCFLLNFYPQLLGVAWIVLLVALFVEYLSLYACHDRGFWSSMLTFRYAHRGLHDTHKPENSMAAFQAAADLGFGVELDVHLTRDGHLAVIHDSELLRVCNRVGVVEELTADELRKFTLLGTAEHIPFLEEVLPLFLGKGPLLVELKTHRGNHAALAQTASDLLVDSGVDFCMESFDPRALLWLRRHRNAVVRGQLSQDFSKNTSAKGWFLDWFLTNLQLNFLTAPDFIAYRFADWEQSALRRCLALWKPALFYWTIRTPYDLRAAEGQGACCIFEQFIPASPKKGEPI